MRTAALALALAAAALAPSTPASAAELSFRLEHNLGPGGAWTIVGSLAGDLGGAVAAAKAGRGIVPGLTLTRAGTELSRAEAATLDGLVRRGGMYKLRATAERASGGPATTTVVVPPSASLVASAPARCVASRGGDAPLKLDGALTLREPGNFGTADALEVTGLTFDFHTLRCSGSTGGSVVDGGGGGGAALPAWSPPASSPVPLWLPAAAPPVLPVPEVADRRPGGGRPGGGGPAGAGAPLLADGAEGGGDGEEDKPPPEPPKRNNWIFILPLAMLVVNLMNAAAPPPMPSAPPASGRGGRRAE